MKVHKFPVHTKMLLCNPDFAFYVELVNVTFIIIYIKKLTQIRYAQDRVAEKT